MLRALLPLTAVLLFTISTQAYQFGYEGREGQPGRDGRDGSSSDNKIVFAQGQALSLDATGSNGEYGGDGYDGENAYNCYQTTPEYNLRGADGGRGGRGGDGGLGGDGGNIMLYATDMANVKRISIDARPGRGGRGGYGNRGGYGCRCQQQSWTLKKCWQEKDKDGKPVTVCSNFTYYCESGRVGEDGRQGYYGNNGRAGSLYLVKSATELPAEMPSAKIYMGDMLKSAVKLSKNIWATRSGAAQLLGAGSFINDNYREFTNRFEATAAFDWKVARPLGDFASEVMALNLKENDIEMSVPKNIWFQTATSGQGDRKTFVFVKMLREAEAIQLSAKATGTGSSLTFDVTDHAKVSDMVNTSFRLKYKTDGFFNKTRYDGPVSGQVVAQGNQSFSLQIGKLPIEAKYLAVGQAIKVELTVTRSLNGKSKEQQIKFDHKIGQ